MMVFKGANATNRKLMHLFVKLMDSVEHSIEDSKDHIKDMLLVAQSLSSNEIDAEPNHTGFGLEVEMYRLQAILGEIGKEIVFFQSPKEETIKNLIVTLKAISLYGLKRSQTETNQS